MSTKSQSFEASMERLDQIVKQLENGSVPLSEALHLFQEGTGLVERCTSSRNPSGPFVSFTISSSAWWNAAQHSSIRRSLRS